MTFQCWATLATSTGRLQRRTTGSTNRLAIPEHYLLAYDAYRKAYLW